MELRSSYNFHFINAIKDGKATKASNVWHGKPALKFKNVDDLYEFVGNGRHRSSARHLMKVLLQELPELEGDETKVENSQVIGGSRIQIKRENGALNANSSHGEREVDEDQKDDDDIDIFNLTLKQIRERFIAKKRKRSSAESSECYPSVGLDNSSSKSEIDDSFMTESLHSLAAKITKNKKMKKKLKRNSNIKLSPHALPIVKFEGVSNCYECPCHSDARSDAHVDVKVEVPECHHADCQAIVLSGMDSSYSWIEPLDSCIFPFDAEHGFGDECDGGIRKTGSADCQAIAVDDMDDSCGWLVPFAPSGVSFDEQPCSSFRCDAEMVIPTVSSDELVESKVLDFQTESVTVDSSAFRPQTSNYFSNEPQCCSGQSHFQMEKYDTDNDDDVFLRQTTTCDNRLENCSVNEMSYEHLKEIVPKPSPCGSITSQYCASNEESDKDIKHVVPLCSDDAVDLGVGVKIQDKAVVVGQFATKLSSSKFEILVVDSHESDEFGESVSPSNSEKLLTVLDESQDDLLVSNSEKLLNDSSQFEITIQYSTECLADSSLHGGEVKDEKTCLETIESCTSAVVEEQVDISFPNSSQNGSLSDDSSADVGMESPLCPSVVSVQRRNFGTHQPVQLVDGEDCCIVEHQQPPERLLSTRKTISSTSQEKLRKAMNSNELDDEQLFQYARKLCYGKRTTSTNGRSDDIKHVKRVENTVSPQQLMRKLKCGKPSFPPNDSPKVARAVRSSPRFSTGSTSIQSCSENAIMFTQNQMRDFESMTTKLAKELKSMKDIVESTLPYKVNSCTTPKFTHQQVSGALEKATKAEETARRWISTMGRDCDRFCKLMKLVQKGNSTPTQAVQKEKRKISFADEAGGHLCHVKTFKREAESIAEEAIIVD
ncbi:hypothetical protein LINGRAHAP2_LOCUS14634 [Linum grandiflorum]